MDPIEQLMQAQLRSWIHELWRGRAQDRERPEAEGAMLEILEAHPEYHALWSLPQAPSEPTLGGTNPYLHVSLHQAVAEQLSSGQPPQVRDAYTRRVQSGDDPHEARHRIMGILVTVMGETVQGGLPFDPSVYARRLSTL